MATIQQSMELQDRMSSTLISIISNLNNTEQAMNRVASANARLTTSLQNTRAPSSSPQVAFGPPVPPGLGQNNNMGPLNDQVTQLNQRIADLEARLQTLGSTSNNATTQASNGFAIWKSVVANFVTELIRGMGDAVKSILNFGNEIINATARLNNINDGLQTTAQLNEKIFLSAQRARSGYEDIRTAVNQMAAAGGELFKNNDQVIMFTELLNKQFKISGTAGQQAASVMFNISQALNTGVLRGQDLNSVLMNTPQIARDIETYMGAARGSIKGMAEDGLITTDIMVGSMFAAADRINEQFNGMGYNFADATTMMSDRFKFAAEDMAVSINQFAGGIFIDAINFMIENIDVLVNALLIVGAIALAVGIGMAAAWMIANWPIALIVAGIILLASVLADFGIGAEEILSFVGGLFGFLGAVIYNMIAGAWNIIVSFLEFLVNGFTGALNAVSKMFVSVFSGILKMVNSVATAIGNLLGQDWSGLTSGLQDNMVTALNIPELKLPKMEGMDEVAAMKAGSEFGKGMGKGITGFTDKIKGMGGGLDAFAGTGGGVDLNLPENLTANTGDGKALKTKSTDKLEISDEDIKLLLDVAMRDVNLQYKQLAPSVTLGDTYVRDETDIDAVANTIADKILELASSDLEIPD